MFRDQAWQIVWTSKPEIVVFFYLVLVIIAVVVACFTKTKTSCLMHRGGFVVVVDVAVRPLLIQYKPNNMQINILKYNIF